VAKAHFRRALRQGDSAVRLRAVVGLASLYLGTDLVAMADVYRQFRIHREASELAAVKQSDAAETRDL
jgi:hypothetical protein